MKVIGQKRLLSNIDKLITNDNLSRFIIINGVYGSGKKLISAYIADKLNATFIPCDIKMESVREVIDLSYALTETTVYMWADADRMSIQAKNAILKITEEPPQNAYFIMTTTNISGVLPTLISRGMVLNMLPYSPDELKEFIVNSNRDVNKRTLPMLVDISTTPQDMLDLLECDLSKMCDVINIFTECIGTTNLGNSLKISTFLKFKDDETDKFNPILFMRGCMFEFNKLLISTNDAMYADLVQCTSKYLADINFKSLSKIATVDNWIIDLYNIAKGGI